MSRVKLPKALASQPFSTRQALDAGVGRGRLRGPDLRHPFRGVHLPAGVQPTFVNRCLALQARLPNHAFFSGVSSARIIGIPLPSRLEDDLQVHVSVPRPKVAPTGRRIVGHVSSFDATVLWNRVRVSPPARAWCELAASLSVPDLVAAGDYLIHHELPIVSAADLRAAAVAWGGRAGSAKIREALPLVNDRSESRRESLLRVLIVTAGFSGLETNYWITTSVGVRYRGDLVFPAEKVVVEYQSRFHDNTKNFASDMTRKSRLETDEWHVFEVNNNDLNVAAELLTRLRTVLERRRPANL